MKILFLHYFFKEDGVTRSVLNNVKGLKELSKDISFVFAGDSFVSSLPGYIEKRYIDWNSSDIAFQLQEISKDADVVIIENPTIGVFPRVTLAFKEYSEKNLDKKIIYRIHDLIEDRPLLFGKFKEVFSDLDKIYPLSKNVSFLTLTSFDKQRLIQKGLNNVSVLPNSVIISDLYPDSKKTSDLRKVFEQKGIINSNERILTYPVRVLRRKNLEEAMLLTKILNNEGGNYRLIITIAFDEDYKKEIENLAQDYKIPCSIGEASKHISFDKKDNFTIADLYSLSDLVISTSVKEGFGFAFIEPWITGTPVIGRKISSVTKDFEFNGIDLSHLYNNDVFNINKVSSERIINIRKILSDERQFNELAKVLNLKERIEKSFNVLEKNKELIKEKYSHLNIAQKLLNQLMCSPIHGTH